MLPVQSPPLSGIVTAFDVVEDIRSCFRSCPVVLPIHPFPFEHPQEALRRGLVRTTPHGTHTAGTVMGRQDALVLLGRKLTAPIRVPDDRCPSRALPSSHQHRLNQQLAVLTRTHRPAHHQARI